MSTPRPLPEDIQCTIDMGGGVRYVFPPRDLGRARHTGWALIAFGLFAWGFTIFWAQGFVGGFVQAVGPWAYLALLLALPGFLGGAAMMGFGLTILFGHAEIALADGVIRCSERVGPFPWTRKVRRDQIVRLAVHGADAAVNKPNSQSTGALMDLAALKAELPSGKARWLAIGYPRPWLLAVAEHLSAELADGSTSFDTKPVPVVTVVDVPSVPCGEMDRHELPDDSLIEQQAIPGGFSLVLPARGVWKGSAGLFGFSLLWCGFMTIFTIGVIAAVLSEKMPPDDHAWWLFPVVITLFWAVGIGMLVAALNMGRREAAIAVVHGQVKLIQTSLFGTTRQDWELDQFATARKGASGMEVNDVPVMQLQLVLKNGKTCGFFTGRDEPELEWIATQLRLAIRGTPAEAGESDAAE